LKKYQTVLSQRYLRSRVVNVIAVVAVMLGVAALILVTSVMDGFARDIESRLRGIMSHVVVGSSQMVGIDDYEQLMARIEKVPEVAACAPLVECPFVLIRSGDLTRFGQVRGVDLERERDASEIEKYLDQLQEDVREFEEQWGAEAAMGLASGENQPTASEIVRYRVARSLLKRELSFQYDAVSSSDDREPAVSSAPENPGALVGAELFGGGRGASVYPGQTISITAPQTILTFESKDFTVVGGFRCRHYEYDSRMVYVPLKAAQDLLGLPGQVTSISVRLRDPRNAEGSRARETKAKIARAIRNPVPLLDLSEPPAAFPVENGTAEVVTDASGAWLQITPDGTRIARLRLADIRPQLAKIGRPTTIAFDIRRSDSGGAPHGAAMVSIIDQSGTEHQPDLGDAQAPLDLHPGVFPAAFQLANFQPPGGLDVLDLDLAKGLAVYVQGGPVAIRDLRLEDRRPVNVLTWRDKQSNFLQAVTVERRVQAVIMSLMVVIAGFSITAILWLMVREKTRDIGILMSLGATRWGIIRIFLMNGLLIGLLGSSFGLATGWAISHNLTEIEQWIERVFHWRLFPPEIYYLDGLPHEESPVQFVMMAVVAMLVSLAAAVWPAVKAAMLNPVEALRYE
jgi:ABC-type lipoprotein release transport system permease subunit